MVMALPVIPESLRVKEALYHYLKGVSDKAPENKAVLRLVRSFEKDLDKGCADYFLDSKKGIDKVLG
ncbi:MAG: hypothetical protein KAR51_03515, partial [Candidatus Aenigmarchaeota archaeon]|nr:hypothetical protein [Candidatus Aenigmarchaeota archaeon]